MPLFTDRELDVMSVLWTLHSGTVAEVRERLDDVPPLAARFWRELTGEPEAALVGPWTMGRDKKNPKPLDTSAFNTLVKTAAEFVRRHEQQLHAVLHQEMVISHAGGRVSVTLDIEPDEENPSALLRATDACGEVLGHARVAPGFRLTRASASAWAQAQFNAQAVR